jgi:predicted RNA-binding protein with PIN domain
MHLLVDGHNLIGQAPGLSLADADDEAQLVLLLRGYATRKRGRQVVVVFDRGVYGHPQGLNGYGVSCHFAKSPQDADAQLIRRLRGLRRPGEWALVSSDRQVARVAEECGVRVIGAREFAAQLRAPAAPPPPAEKPDARLSEAEVEEWLRVFGEIPGEVDS